MVAGHLFKGGMYFTTGYLAHLDMKRFEINDSTIFLPPNPFAWTTAAVIGSMAPKAPEVPSIGDFFATYFAGKSYSCHDAKFSTILVCLKKYWENHRLKTQSSNLPTTSKALKESRSTNIERLGTKTFKSCTQAKKNLI